MASSECNGNAGGFLMSNTRLLQAAMPAERMRGAKFCEDFRDHLSMIKGGWTLTGAPLFAKNGGLVLNGTSQYASIPLGNELASTTITVHLEWIPTSAIAASQVILDTSATNRFCLSDLGGGKFGVYICGTQAHRAVYALWNAALLVGKRNVLTITMVSGTVAIVWLNGTLIANEMGVTAPVAGATTPLIIGKHYSLALYYAGTISRILIGHYLCTLAEHQAYYNRTMWNWEDRCLVNLQMRTGDYDPTAVRTLDSSGHDLHATLGDGVTPTTYPAQQKGSMLFDGGDYLSCGDAAALRLTSTGTILLTFKMTAFVTYTVLACKGNFETGKYSYLLYLNTVTRQLNAQIGTAAAGEAVTSSTYPAVGPIYTVAFTWDGSWLRLYCNGIEVGSHVQTINAVDNGYPYRISSDAASANYYLTGCVYDNKVLKEALNAVQVAQYHIDQMSRLGAQQ